MWQPPLITNGVITGYDVRFIRGGTIGTPILKAADESFHVIVDGDIPFGDGDVIAQVSGNVTAQVKHCIMHA